MSLQLGPRRVTAPDGVEWRVGRRWVTRRFRWSWKRRGNPAPDALANAGSFPVPDNLDFGEGLLLVAAVTAAALILIPVLFFGIEIIVVGALLAAGVVSRVVLRKPWVVDARSRDSLTAGRELEWNVRGLRQSRELIDRVAADLAAGREPPQSTLPR